MKTNKQVKRPHALLNVSRLQERFSTYNTNSEDSFADVSRSSTAQAARETAAVKYAVYWSHPAANCLDGNWVKRGSCVCEVPWHRARSIRRKSGKTCFAWCGVPAFQQKSKAYCEGTGCGTEGTDSVSIFYCFLQTRHVSRKNILLYGTANNNRFWLQRSPKFPRNS